MPQVDFRLLRSQRNTVAQGLKHAGLDPADFAWEDATDAHARLGSRLVHRQSGYSLLFEHMQGGLGAIPHWKLSRHPGLELPREAATYRFIGEALEQGVAKWTEALRREILEPDLFELASSRASLASATATADEVQFSDEEASRLSDRLDGIENAFAERLGAQESELRDLREQIEFLRRTIKSSPRGVWRRAAFFSVLQLARAYMGDEAKEFIGWAWQALAGDDEPPMIGG